MNEIFNGDCLQILKSLPVESVQTCITSPPYWKLRKYTDDPAEVGIENELDAYLDNIRQVFSEVKRVLRADGTLWLNIGDTFAGGGGYSPNSPSNKSSKQSTNKGSIAEKRPIPNGCKRKDLIGVPWEIAFRLRSDGWFLRSDIIWDKPDAFPEKVTDRPTRSHEYVFLLSKNAKYKYLPLLEQGSTGPRNMRSVWSISKSKSLKSDHTATFPKKLVERCLSLTTEPGDRVLDCFCGSGTSGVVAAEMGRYYWGVELNPAHASLASQNLEKP